MWRHRAVVCFRAVAYKKLRCAVWLGGPSCVPCRTVRGVQWAVMLPFPPQRILTDTLAVNPGAEYATRRSFPQSPAGHRKATTTLPVVLRGKAG